MGALNLDAVPIPSIVPERPCIDPAIVETTPAGVIILIALFPVSATYEFPLVVSTAIPHGELNAAAPPTASTNPLVAEPARVIT